jgi:excisionase family DNA binding protein
MDIGADPSRDGLQSAKPITVTVATARKLSGLGNTTVWALLKGGQLDAVRVGRRTLITFRSLEALLSPGSAPQCHGQGRPRKYRPPMETAP